MRQVRARVLAGCAFIALGFGGCASDTAAPTPAVAQAPAAGSVATISVLSSRADLVTGGDARVQIDVSDGIEPRQLIVTVNGAPVGIGLNGTDNGQLGWRSASLEGVIRGLKDGRNVIEVTGPAGAAASLELVNHPSTGPVLSGPHLAPYECRTKESGLGDPTDANCSAPTRTDRFYKSTDGAFKPYPYGAGVTEPSDIATTTTIDGKTVPYVVHVESGVINRSIYRIAKLIEYPGYIRQASGRVPDGIPPWEPWNGRLAVTFGGGCGTQYNQGANQAASPLNDLYLSRGFAYMNATELVNQQHCNQVLQGETLMMLKEHFIEAYGVPKWTVGTGGSGGAIQQMVITQMYPGLLDGLQPSASFPDSSMQTADCGLLQRFWKSPAGESWSQAKKTAVEGMTPGTCAAWERSFVRTIQAGFADGCAVSDKSLVYDPKTNPKGIRCTTQEMRVNIYGRDPTTGFARRPIDNVGIQYGLKALNDGTISVDEFLTLNENIGGNDIDGGFAPDRTTGDPEAIRAIYASGLFNTFGGGLANVPILNYRGYTDAVGDIHDRHRDLTIRARLEKATGRSDNQVIWVGPPRAEGAANLGVEALDVMTQWLDAIAADPSPLNAGKVVRHKPAKAVDAYWLVDGTMKAEKAGWDNTTGFGQTYPVHSEPRMMAGAPPANDIMKCQLKPVNVDDYAVSFSKAQQDRLARVFPGGVCDWTKPSVGYSMIKGTYQRY